MPCTTCSTRTMCSSKTSANLSIDTPNVSSNMPKIMHKNSIAPTSKQNTDNEKKNSRKPLLKKIKSPKVSSPSFGPWKQAVVSKLLTAKENQNSSTLRENNV